MNLRGRTALVTGASGGIGESLAKRIAELGGDLVITGRDEERLALFAAELRQRYGVAVEVLVADLADPSGAGALYAQTEGRGRQVDILINNAGFANCGPFSTLELDRLRAELLVDIEAVAELTHRFLKAMTRRGSGWILNVSSVVSFMPVPGYASYAAAKAYVRSLSEALAVELEGSGVRVCCLCPGAVRTGFYARAGHGRISPLLRFMMTSPDRVARAGMTGLMRGRRLVVVGIAETLVVWLTRFVPRRLLLWLAGRVAV